MKKYSFNQWCRTDWLKCSLLISGVMILLILVNWNTWVPSLKCIAAVTAMVPIHATEEWIFPGGFAYQYNLFLYNSDHPLACPMNRASDIITVLGTTLMFGAVTIGFALSGHVVPSGILLGAFCFSMLEVSVHTYFGIRAYLKFRENGKSTIYGTGSMTAYVGFLPLATLLLRQVSQQGLSGFDVGLCLLVLSCIALLCFVPEAKFKDPHSPYAYRTKGYYERFTRR